MTKSIISTILVIEFIMKKLFTAFCLFLTFLLTACSEDIEQVSISGHTMGTTYTVKYLSAADKTLPPPADVKVQLDNLLKEVNRQMSTYMPDSEISRFNHLDKLPMTMPISDDFAKVVAEAIRLHKVTHGALDVTVGPLVNMWGFGPDKTIQKRPTVTQLDDVREIVGIDKITLQAPHKNGEPYQLSKTRKGVYVDLSSIAKGFGVDKVADYLEQISVNNYLVEIGGELRARGANAAKQVWRVGIEQPSVVQKQATQMVVPLHNLAMATSGDYRNFHTDETGQRLSHIINPQTFEPINHQLASITVIHPSAMTADGLSTGLFVLGEQEALAVAEREGLAVFLIIKTADGFTTKMSSAFQNLLN